MADQVINQTEDERQIIKFIEQKLFEPARKWKYYYAGDKHETWLSNIKWYKGQQWSSKRSKEKSSIFFNRIFSTIQKELPFMTDRRPKIFVQPQEPGDKIPASIIQKIIESKWVECGMELKLPEGVMHAKQLGTGFFRPYWNQNKANGLGDIDCEVVDPLEMFPFAYTKRLEDGEGCIRAEWVSLGWIRKNYPKEGWRVKSEGAKDSFVPDRCKETNKGGGEGYAQVTDTTGARTDYLPSSGGGGLDSSDTKRILFVRCLIKDGSTKDSEKEVDGKKQTTKEAVYPNGREICYANGIVLSDEPYQFECFPGFVEILNYIEPSEFWAESDIVQIKEGQKELNKLQAMIIDAVKRGVYTTKFVQKGSGIDADDFIVSSDAVYESSMPNPVTELVPQALPPQIFSYSQQIEQAIATTAGAVEYNPPTTGDLPSGRAMGQLAEITQTRLRQKIRNLSYTIRMIGKAWLEMILKNYTDQRIMRIFNSNNGQQEYVYIFREDKPQLADEIKQKVTQEIIPGTEQKDPQGQVIPGSGTPKYQYVLNMAEIKGGLDLEVADNSTVSVSKTATFDQAMALFQLQAIDKQALLDAAEYPNKEEILKRMDKQASAGAQAAQQHEQQQTQTMMQLEGAKLQTDVKTTQMDNETKIMTEAMKHRQKSLDMEKQVRLHMISEAMGNTMQGQQGMP